MANPWRGEVALVVDGEPRVMRLTLGALAELEARLKSESLIELIGRFETGRVPGARPDRAASPGLNGGGWRIGEAELVQRRSRAGRWRRREAAARLLKITFTLPDEDAGMTRIAWGGLMQLGLVRAAADAGGVLEPDAGGADADGRDRAGAGRR